MIVTPPLPGLGTGARLPIVPHTVADFTHMGENDWRDWFVENVRTWQADSLPGSTPKLPFFPLYVARTEDDPGAMLAQELDGLPFPVAQPAATAAASLLASSYAPSTDGVPGARLLIRFCALLDAQGLADALLHLAGRLEGLAEADQDRLICAIAAAACLRCKIDDIWSIADDLIARDLLRRGPAAYLVARLAARQFNLVFAAVPRVVMDNNHFQPPSLRLSPGRAEIPPPGDDFYLNVFEELQFAKTRPELLSLLARRDPPSAGRDRAGLDDFRHRVKRALTIVILGPDGARQREGTQFSLVLDDAGEMDAG